MEKSMWLRFIVTDETTKSGDVVFTDSYDKGADLVDRKIAARCLDSKGTSFEEAAPEDVVAVISKDNTPEDKKKMRQGYLW